MSIDCINIYSKEGRDTYPNLMKKSFLVLSFLVLSLIFSVSVSASTFTDVPETHQYYESIEYLAENNVVHGSGKGIFAPDRFITLNEVSIILRNAFAPEMKAYGPIPVCLSKDWIPLYIAIKDLNSTLTKGELYNVISKTEGINVYASLNREFSNSILESDYLKAMQEVGLATEKDETNEYMTRGQFSFIIHQMMINNIQTQTPEDMKLINIEIDSTQNLGAYRYELSKIPKSILEEFSLRDWTLSIGIINVLKLNQENNLSASAWTNYVDKKIYIKDTSSLAHEFGHFVYMTINFDSYVNYLYSLEGEAFQSVYGKYSYNKHEYFAEYFKELINSQNNKHKMEELKKVTPKTFNYFNNLYILQEIFE